MESVNQLREQIIEVGRRLYQRGMCGSNDGNISIRLSENRFLATCTNVSKGFMKPEHIIIMDDKAELVEGEYAPTPVSSRR